MTTQRERFEAWAEMKFGRHLPTHERDECGYFDLRTDAAWLAWQEAERQTIERCAKVCDAEADKCEQAAQRAIENGEREEVSAIRSTAWKLSIAASRIRSLSASQATTEESSAVQHTDNDGTPLPGEE